MLYTSIYFRTAAVMLKSRNVLQWLRDRYILIVHSLQTQVTTPTKIAYFVRYKHTHVYMYMYTCIYKSCLSSHLRSLRLVPISQSPQYISALQHGSRCTEVVYECEITVQWVYRQANGEHIAFVNYSYSTRYIQPCLIMIPVPSYAERRKGICKVLQKIVMCSHLLVCRSILIMIVVWCRNYICGMLGSGWCWKGCFSTDYWSATKMTRINSLLPSNTYIMYSV